MNDSSHCTVDACKTHDSTRWTAGYTNEGLEDVLANNIRAIASVTDVNLVILYAKNIRAIAMEQRSRSFQSPTGLITWRDN